MGREAEARDVLRGALEQQVWGVPLQYPGEYHPQLRSSGVPPTSRVACVPRLLEAHGARLVAATRRLLARSEQVRLAAGGAWGDGVFTMGARHLARAAQGVLSSSGRFAQRLAP